MVAAGGRVGVVFGDGKQCLIDGRMDGWTDERRCSLFPMDEERTAQPRNYSTASAEDFEILLGGWV